MRAAVPVLLLLGACAGARAAPADPSSGVVERVIDGDTIDVAIGGTTERVRLIGIDTPEVAHPAMGERPANPAECFGDEASAYTAALLPEGTTVRLERDVVPRDDYGRLLAYVHTDVSGSDLFVNLEIVRLGYAQPLTIEPNDTFATTIVAAAVAAQASGAGLWGACSGGVAQ